MTCLTRHLLMASVQRKFSLTGMVEADLFPGLSHVTGAALTAEDPEMTVLAEVAGHAFCRRAFECLVNVTSGTARVRVSPLQRKICARVIECPGLPGCF